MYYPNTYLLSEYLRTHGYPEHANDSGWSIDEIEFTRHLSDATSQHPDESDVQHHARAAFRTLSPIFDRQRRAQPAKEVNDRLSSLEHTLSNKCSLHDCPIRQFPRWLIILVAILLVLFTAIDAFSQQPLNTRPALVNTSAPTLTTGARSELSMTTAGGLRVDLSGTTVNVNFLTANISTSISGGTVTANFNTANIAVNLAQVNGATVLTGVGTSAAAQRVALSPIDPCSPDSNVTRGFTAVSLTTSSQIITGSAPNFVYVCSISLVAASATNVAVVAGTGSVCATSIAGVFGGSTAATGYNFAANGGIAFGNGGASIGRSDATGENLCILVSAANQISGSLTYVLAP